MRLGAKRFLPLFPDDRCRRACAPFLDIGLPRRSGLNEERGRNSKATDVCPRDDPATQYPGEY